MAEQDAKYYEQLGTMSGMTGSERREAGLIPKTTKTTNGYYENVKNFRANTNMFSNTRRFSFIEVKEQQITRLRHLNNLSLTGEPLHHGGTTSSFCNQGVCSSMMEHPPNKSTTPRIRTTRNMPSIKFIM